MCTRLIMMEIDAKMDATTAAYICKIGKGVSE
jgi:hypothetical protein